MTNPILDEQLDRSYKDLSQHILTIWSNAIASKRTEVNVTPSGIQTELKKSESLSWFSRLSRLSSILGK